MKENSLVFSLFVFIFFFGQISCRNQKEHSGLISIYFKNDGYASDSLYSAFRKEGTKIISGLINEIENDERKYTGQSSPYDSDKSWNYTFLGVRAAYMVEGILSDSVNAPLLYTRGVIVKGRSDYPDSFQKIEREDLPALKDIYYKWWKLNRDKSLEELTKDWRENRRPLNGTQYLWY